MTGRTKLTYAEYQCFPADGRRHELIDGAHVVNPAPGTYHQTLSRRIQFQLYVQVELCGLGQVFNAPTDLQLSPHDIVQPDLILVLEPRQRIITPSRIQGVPDLVVEILSESSVALDRKKKRELYARSGVPEYWIVDPEKRVLEQHLLAGDRYELAASHREEVVFRGLPEVCVDLTEVW